MKRAAVVVLVFLLALTAALAGRNDRARVTINDNFFPGSQALFSDGKGTYVDWQLSCDPCVTAWVAADGFFFTYLYRGSNFTDDCNQHFPSAVRTFVLKFPASSGICTALGLTADESGICTLSGHGQPRIRAEKAFASRATETPVAFLFSLNGSSYSLETAGGTSGSGNLRTVSNTTRTATLKLVSSAPKKPQPVGSAFVFQFEMTIERVQQ